MNEEEDVAGGCAVFILVLIIGSMLMLFFINTEYRLARVEKLLKLDPPGLTEMFTK